MSTTRHRLWDQNNDDCMGIMAATRGCSVRFSGLVLLVGLVSVAEALPTTKVGSLGAEGVVPLAKDTVAKLIGARHKKRRVSRRGAEGKNVEVPDSILEKVRHYRMNAMGGARQNNHGEGGITVDDIKEAMLRAFHIKNNSTIQDAAVRKSRTNARSSGGVKKSSMGKHKQAAKTGN